MNFYTETINIADIQFQPDLELSDEMIECLDRVNNILMKNDVEVVRTLQLYFVKMFKSMLQINASQFKELIIKDLSQKVQWIQNCEII